MLDLEKLEWCRACRDRDRATPAIVILWGKLFPSEALGPCCWDHAALHVDMRSLDQWAVFDLRPLVAELRAAWEVIDKARQHNDCSVCAKAIAAYDKLAGEAPQ